MKTKVKIETFKESGAFYDSIKYETLFRCFDTENIFKEAALKVPQKDMDYTIEIDDTLAWNKWLIKV